MLIRSGYEHGADIFNVHVPRGVHVIDSIAEQLKKQLEATTRGLATDDIDYDLGQFLGDGVTVLVEYAGLVKAAKGISGAIKNIPQIISSTMSHISGFGASLVPASGPAIESGAAVAGSLVEGGAIADGLTIAADILFNYSAFKNDWNTLKGDMDKETPKETGKQSKEVLDSNGGASDTIPDLSDKAVKHPMNDHMPSYYAKQLQYMDKASAEQHLSKNTFFNKEWTSEQVRSALNRGYKAAIENGVTSGKYTFTYLGEEVTVYLQDGVFKTGYGAYSYTYEELLELLQH